LETIKQDLEIFRVGFDNWFSESKIAFEKDGSEKLK
jgi:arginyl-tRNA synthetase